MIPFGRFAVQRAEKEETGKPATFDFLGFTHYCGKSSKGTFRVKRKTSRKKFKAALLQIKEWLQRNMHQPLDSFLEKLRIKISGYNRYYGITDNSDSLSRYLHEVRMRLYRCLNRRSQKASYTWKQYLRFLEKAKLPRPRIYVNIYERRSHIGYIT